MPDPSSSAAPQTSSASPTDKKPERPRRPRNRKPAAANPPPPSEAPPAAQSKEKVEKITSASTKNPEPPTPTPQTDVAVSDSKEKKRQRNRPTRGGEKKPAVTAPSAAGSSTVETEEGPLGLKNKPQLTSSAANIDKGKDANPSPPQNKTTRKDDNKNSKKGQQQPATVDKKPRRQANPTNKDKDSSGKKGAQIRAGNWRDQKEDKETGNANSNKAPGSKAKAKEGGENHQPPSSAKKSNKKTNSKAKRISYYEDHLSPEELNRGLSSGALLQGQIRVNASDRTQGFITIPGLPNDIFIKGIKPQNRAIEGDRVVVRVNPPHLWHQQKKVANAVAPFSSSSSFSVGFCISSNNDNGVASHHHNELLATPALVRSASGGECDYDLESVPSSSSRASSPSFSAFLDGDVALMEGEEVNGGSIEVTVEKMESLTLVAEEGDEEGAAVSMVDFIEQKVVAKLEQKKEEEEEKKKKDTSSSPPPVWHGTNGIEKTVQVIASKIEQHVGWRATAEVVGIFEFSKRRTTIIGVLRAGTINPDGDDDKSKGKKTDRSHLSFIPTDARLPSMLVRHDKISKECRQKLIKEASNADMVTRTLVMAHIDRWNATTPYPFVIVDGEIGEAGSLQAETRALLEQEGIIDDDVFNKGVLSCLPPTPWAISPEDLNGRRDFRNQRVFSIDPPTARDLDDALSIERLGNSGKYRVGVHIADVSHFVKAGTALDAEAGERSTSVYLVDRVIPMLPRLLCEELCSLNPGVDRLAFSIVWELDEQGKVVGETWAGRSVICSCGKLAYPMVQAMIEGEYSAKPGEEPPCELHGNYQWTDVYEDCMALYKISRNLRQRRFDNGALRLDNVRLYYELDNEGKPVDCGVYVQKEANQLVEEFMLLANMTAASIVSESYPDRALLRCHPPPNGEKMTELTQMSQMHLGVFLDTSSSKALQKSLEALRNDPNADRGAVDVITMMATKPMQLAKYFCTGSEADDANWRHYALATERYTHFTSPIRRYPDIIVHRLLAAALEEKYGNQESSSLIEKYGLAACDKVTDISNHANDRKVAAKSAQDNSLRLYLAIMLFDRPRVVDGVVMALNGSRFLDLYVPSLGIDVRVQTAEILKGGADFIATKWDSAMKELVIERDGGKVSKSPELGMMDYNCVNNMDKLDNGGEKEGNRVEVAKQQLPLTLRLLTHVPLVLTAQRSKTSGSPSRIVARFWLE
jgi:DIS3-like exonuclease 2